MKDIEIKKCRNCGKAASVYVCRAYGYEDSNLYYVCKCDDKRCDGNNAEAVFESAILAIENWNKRMVE